MWTEKKKVGGLILGTAHDTARARHEWARAVGRARVVPVSGPYKKKVGTAHQFGGSCRACGPTFQHGPLAIINDRITKC